jgi:hypothetical protein
MGCEKEKDNFFFFFFFKPRLLEKWKTKQIKIKIENTGYFDYGLNSYLKNYD